MPNQYTHPWISKEIKFVCQNIKKLKYKEMGKILSRSIASIQSKVRYLPVQQKIKKYKVNINFFKNWSSEMVYVLRFIAADGNVCHSGRAHVLHIASDDRDIIFKIKKVLNSKAPISAIKRENNKISYNLRICDREIFKDLKKLGIVERKSLVIISPKIPQEFVRHYIRGYFDGDGSVYLRTHKYPSKLRAIFYTGSFAMAKFIFGVLQKIAPHFEGRIRKKRNKNNYILHLGQKASEALFNYMYKDASIFMERKFNKFIKGMDYDRSKAIKFPTA